MATAAQIEQFTAALGSSEPQRNRSALVQGLSTAKTNLAQLGISMDNAAAIEVDLTDATAGQWLDGQPAALASAFTAGFGGIDTFAQFIADLSERAGLEGGASELRLYQAGTVVAVTQDA